MIKVLVVDDSLVVRNLLKYIFDSDPEITVIATAENGLRACEIARQTKPDLITMDIAMPVMNGLEATQKILEFHPVPIVIISANWNPDEVEITFKAMEAGAVALLEKPAGPGQSDFQKEAEKLIATVKSMAGVKVVKRSWNKIANREPIQNLGKRNDITHVVAIGASTGGPPVIASILSELPSDFPMPILIVQHISPGFVKGFADWMNQISNIPVCVASNLQNILNSRVYIAPDNFHMGVDAFGHIVLHNSPPENGLRPAVSWLFRSVLKAFGKNGVGVLLTGMGKDGSVDLKQMREDGALTLAQNQETSVVFGMPGEAVKLNAARHVLPPEGIAGILKTYAESIRQDLNKNDLTGMRSRGWQI